MTTPNLDELSRRIEQVIKEHLAASERAVTSAIARAFASSPPRSTATRKAALPAGGGRRRRPSTEIAALGERLYGAVCARPGETMAVLMVDIGMSARELNRPMNQLKRLGRIRSVGQRHQARYYPMAARP